MSSSRKRVISSCIPCYTRKQKCNREYPCNHCTRRQRIDGCVYNPIASNQSTTSSPPSLHVFELRRDVDGAEKPPIHHPLRDEWCEAFGYFQYSNSNTLALIKKLGVACYEDSPSNSSPALGTEAVNEVHRVMERMPDRQVMDFLVQFFATEICWVDQLVHVPWLLEKYQSWHAVEWARLASDVEFAVLILRICSYALQFLPSPTYPLDRIRGELLADLREACDDAADTAEAISTTADGRGSPIRVQHIAFLGLKCQAEGKMRDYTEALGRAIRIAQNIGMHCENVRPQGVSGEVDREMARRIFCNLYIWDSLLSRQLDRAPLLPGNLSNGSQPQLQLLGDQGSTEPPPTPHRSHQRIHPFTERLLQARLADFWRGVGPLSGAEYDAMAAEERHEKFCREFLPQLPQAFALTDPDESWDEQSPRLPLQRKLLHMAIYDSLYWNFRPLLLRQPSPLPTYKAILLGFQRKALAAAALGSIDSAGQLHSLLGGRHTRFAGIVVSTFEAAVLLFSLLADSSFPGEPQHHDAPPHGPDPLQAGISKLSRFGCLHAIQGGLDRLKMLAEASTMADLGSSTLTQLLSRLSEGDRGSLIQGTTDASTPGSQGGGDGKKTGESAAVGSVESSAGAVTVGWLPGGSGPPDHGLAVDFTPLSGTAPPAVAGVSQWLSFDAANIAMYTRGDFWEDTAF